MVLSSTRTSHHSNVQKHTFTCGNTLRTKNEIQPIHLTFSANELTDIKTTGGNHKEGEQTIHYRTHRHAEMDLEVGQPIWHQDPHTKKWNTGAIHEELEEPHSYTIQDSARQYYRRNWNWIKPR